MYSDAINEVSLWGLEGLTLRVRVIGKGEGKRKGESMNSRGQLLACYNAPVYYRHQK